MAAPRKPKTKSVLDIRAEREHARASHWQWYTVGGIAIGLGAIWAILFIILVAAETNNAAFVIGVAQMIFSAGLLVATGLLVIVELGRSNPDMHIIWAGVNENARHEFWVHLVNRGRQATAIESAEIELGFKSRPSPESEPQRTTVDVVSMRKLGENEVEFQDLNIAPGARERFVLRINEVYTHPSLERRRAHIRIFFVLQKKPAEWTLQGAHVDAE